MLNKLVIWFMYPLWWNRMFCFFGFHEVVVLKGKLCENPYEAGMLRCIHCGIHFDETVY